MNRCAFPVLDSESRARSCGAPATTTRIVSGFGAPGVELDVCDLCAAAIDSPGDGPKARCEATAPIVALIERARGTHHAPGSHPPKRRIVVRIDAPEVDRLDALLGHFPEASRASLIRAFVAFGLRAAEEHARVTPAKEGGAP